MKTEKEKHSELMLHFFPLSSFFFFYFVRFLLQLISCTQKKRKKWQKAKAFLSNLLVIFMFSSAIRLKLMNNLLKHNEENRNDYLHIERYAYINHNVFLDNTS